MCATKNNPTALQQGTYPKDLFGFKLNYNTVEGNAGAANKLITVVDNSNNTSGFNDFNKTGNDYAYDVNGNMNLDKNKKITAITYNHLNLPTKIVFTTGNIVYIYNAAGQKVQKVVTTTTPASVVTTDYLGGYQYKNTVLQFFPTAEGYVKNTANVFSYVFNYTDLLGNVRLSYTKDATTGSLKILDENNYYPFGLMHKGYNNLVSTNNPAEKLLFNGKELQDELGLDMYDFGARLYDRQLNIWRTPDPKAETSRRFSPYAYALNNPVYFIDPDGMEAQRPPLRGTKAFNEFVNNIVNGNKGQVVNWNDKDGSWTYNAKTQTWVGIGDSKGNDIAFNNKNSNTDKRGGFAFADGGNAQDPSSLDKGGRDVQWVDFKGMLEIVTTLLGLDKESPAAGKVTPDTKTKNAIDAVDNAASAVKANEEGKSKSPEMVQTVKDSKNPNNNQWVRKDVLDTQQKKKDEN